MDISDLSKINLQICIWKRKSQRIKEYIIKAECYIFLINFVNTLNERIENKKVIKTAEIESDLWLEGKNMGKLTAKFSIEHYPYTRQKLAGVMTEQGLQKSAPIIMGKGNNPKIKELSVSLNELKELYFNENTANNEIQVMIEQKLSFINKLLQESDKISSVSFIYKDIQEIMNAQLIFIEI